MRNLKIRRNHLNLEPGKIGRNNSNCTQEANFVNPKRRRVEVRRGYETAQLESNEQQPIVVFSVDFAPPGVGELRTQLCPMSSKIFTTFRIWKRPPSERPQSPSTFTISIPRYFKKFYFFKKQENNINSFFEYFNLVKFSKNPKTIRCLWSLNF